MRHAKNYATVKRYKANKSMVLNSKNQKFENRLDSGRDSYSPVKPKKLTEKIKSDIGNRLTSNLMQKLTQKRQLRQKSTSDMEINKENDSIEDAYYFLDPVPAQNNDSKPNRVKKYEESPQDEFTLPIIS